jgi:hypothetical protein
MQKLCDAAPDMTYIIIQSPVPKLPMQKEVPIIYTLHNDRGIFETNIILAVDVNTSRTPEKAPAAKVGKKNLYSHHY